MKNPWLSLRGTGSPYIFEKDRAKIDTYNRFVPDPRAKVIPDVIPEPFIGNPNSAQVVFLGLNPGYSISDPVWHAKGALLCGLANVRFLRRLFSTI